MSERQWYYTVAGKQAGPVFESALLLLFQSGQLRPETMVWTEGMDEWVAASSIEGLVPNAQRPPPFTPPIAGYATGGYAGFWKRVAAAFIDGLILLAAGMVLGTVTSGGDLLGIVVSWLYAALLESSSKQATLGKMALGIQVTDLEGNRISFGRATGRHFGKIISTLVLFIGFIMAAFTDRKQTLHDIMAGCLVVKK